MFCRLLRLVSSTSLLLALSSALALAAPFGVEWVAPSYARVLTGQFRRPGQLDIVAANNLGTLQLLDANTGRLAGTVAASISPTSGTRVVIDLDGDGSDELVQWTNSAGNHFVEAFDWNGSGLVSRWLVSRPGILQRLEFANVFGDSRMQLVVLHGSTSPGIEVFDVANGALLHELTPISASQMKLTLDEWDTTPGTDLMVERSTASSETSLLIGKVGAGIGTKWTFNAKVLTTVRIVQPDHRDLVAVTTSGQVHLYSGDTGGDLGLLPATFNSAPTASNQILDIEGDGAEELLNNGSLFDWNGSQVYRRWVITEPYYSTVQSKALVEMDGNLASYEVALRGTQGVAVLNAFTGAFRYDSRIPPVSLGSATNWWVGEFDPTSGASEIMAYFPASGPTPAKLILVGGLADSIRTRWNRNTDDLIGVDHYRDFDHLDVLERNAPNTQAYLYDGGTGEQAVVMPPAFEFSTPFLTQVTDLDGNGVPELLHRSAAGGGLNGTRRLEWNGTTFALTWQSSQAYPATAIIGVDEFTADPGAEISILSTNRITILRGDTGAQIYDSVPFGYQTIANPIIGSWETYGSAADILFDGQISNPTLSLYLLSTTPPGTDAPSGPRADRVELLPAAPNPARGGATVEFRLPRAAHVTLGLFDTAGRHVRDLALGARLAGAHRVFWDGVDDSGHATPAGVYWLSLAVGSQVLTQRLVRLP